MKFGLQTHQVLSVKFLQPTEVFFAENLMQLEIPKVVVNTRTSALCFGLFVLRA